MHGTNKAPWTLNLLSSTSWLQVRGLLWGTFLAALNAGKINFYRFFHFYLSLLSCSRCGVGSVRMDLVMSLWMMGRPKESLASEYSAAHWSSSLKVRTVRLFHHTRLRLVYLSSYNLYYEPRNRDLQWAQSSSVVNQLPCYFFIFKCGLKPECYGLVHVCSVEKPKDVLLLWYSPQRY